jgi:hypothetical protein
MAVGNGQDLHDAVVRTIKSVGRAADSMSVSASWTDTRDWDAGVTADADGFTVHYGPATKATDTPEEAAAILKGIFADEIVCVTALEKDTPVHYALARHDDPTSSFTRLDGPGGSSMPAIDHVMIRSWSGKRDQD